jgi:hypothetical protein
MRAAEGIAAAYAAEPAVAAVIVGGSTAHGHADRHSDLELFVAWSRPPTEDDRAAAIARARGDLVHLYPSDAGLWADAWKVERRGGEAFTGIEVDMSHGVVETVERILADVVERFDPDPDKLLFAGGVLDGVALHGAETVERWQERVRLYPAGLQEAVVRAHAQIEGLWRLDAYAERDNPIGGYRVLVSAQEDLLHTLLAINRVYYAGFKSLEAVCAGLAIAPADLLTRLRSCYPLSPTSKTTLAALVEETYDLVERHLPGIDVALLRTYLRYERPLWD